MSLKPTSIGSNCSYNQRYYLAMPIVRYPATYQNLNKHPTGFVSSVGPLKKHRPASFSRIELLASTGRALLPTASANIFDLPLIFQVGRYERFLFRNHRASTCGIATFLLAL
ncbi:hypothetical protein Plhal304r1_c034g0106591 [Plasmopara halstedii]